jgi:hypothetical protein
MTPRHVNGALDLPNESRSMDGMLVVDKVSHDLVVSSQVQCAGSMSDDLNLFQQEIGPNTPNDHPNTRSTVNHKSRLKSRFVGKSQQIEWFNDEGCELDQSWSRYAIRVVCSRHDCIAATIEGEPKRYYNIHLSYDRKRLGPARLRSTTLRSRCQDSARATVPHNSCVSYHTLDSVPLGTAPTSNLCLALTIPLRTATSNHISFSAC